VKVSVVVHPNARNERIEKDLLGVLHVYVTEPPLEGKANKAVTELLAEHFSTKKRNVFLVSGQRAKHKTFEVTTDNRNDTGQLIK